MFFNLNQDCAFSIVEARTQFPRENTISIPEHLQNFGPDLVKHLCNFRLDAFPSHSVNAFRRLKPYSMLCWT